MKAELIGGPYDGQVLDVEPSTRKVNVPLWGALCTSAAKAIPYTGFRQGSYTRRGDDFVWDGEA